ncbi:hypothetical protein TWF481_011482 [Arthrobotrys musiformis]|uniref:Uncharacterized protein n=1 Tax=Arthrobotrys musiformis TaxID=47236 RepID=A0AAV9VZK6_9PEZI
MNPNHPNNPWPAIPAGRNGGHQNKQLPNGLQTRANPTLNQRKPYVDPRSSGQLGVNHLTTASQPSSIRRFLAQPPSTEPTNARVISSFAPQENLQTDCTQLSDSQTGYDQQNIGGGYSLPGPSPVQNTGPYYYNTPQNFPAWAMGGISAPASVPGPTGAQATPDLVNTPSLVLSRPNANHDAQGERTRKRPRGTPPPGLRDLPKDHKYYKLFNYPKYTPPTSNKGTAMGTRSLDHHPDSDLENAYASYLFQSDPVEYWLLRDVAEKVPTKIREKEIAYHKQLSNEDEPAEAAARRIKIGDTPGESSALGTEGFASPPKSKEKRSKTEKSSLPKGRRNWIENYKDKFPGQPIPSSRPNWRPTTHVLLQAGRSEEGPQDFHSLILNTLGRCRDDPDFLELLIQKVASCGDPQSSLAYESESTDQSEGFQGGSFDSHSPRGTMSEGAPTDASSHPRRYVRAHSVRSSQSYGRSPSRRSMNTHTHSTQVITGHGYMHPTIQTNFPQSYPGSPSRPTASAPASAVGFHLSPTQFQNSHYHGGHGGSHRSEDMDSSSYIDHTDHEGSYSQPAATIPETGVIPEYVGAGVGDDLNMEFPYAPAIEPEDVKPGL